MGILSFFSFSIVFSYIHIFPCNEHNHSARSAHRLSLPAHPIWHLSTNIFLQQSFPLHTIDNLLALPLCFNNHHLEQQRNHLIEAAPLDVLGRQEKGLKGDLNAWLKSREKVSVERLLLTRPSAWPVKVSDVKVKL